jgi:hypothetical protein
MRFLPAILVFGAAGASYVYTQDGGGKILSPASWISDSSATTSNSASAQRLAAAPKEEMVAVAGPEISNFGEVFRFDLTPKAVTERWSRVSTGLSDARFQGYRVPLMTGISESDLAGSLTYYFDNQPRLRRVTFLGTTGDPQRLIEFVTRQFGFRRFQNGNPRVTAYQVQSRYSGRLQIAHAEVIDKNLASTNYQIELSLER